jgi:hypothetical protein
MLECDPGTRNSTWQGVSLAPGALADPRVLAAVSPAEGESFVPNSFLRSNETLYLLATGAGADKGRQLGGARRGIRRGCRGVGAPDRRS